MKKGQGLSITTIVVAAIALLVLVVLVAIFTGQIGDTSKAMKNCQSTLRGDCYESVTSCIGDGKISYAGKNDCQGTDKPVCCIPIIAESKKTDSDSTSDVEE